MRRMVIAQCDNSRAEGLGKTDRTQLLLILGPHWKLPIYPNGLNMAGRVVTHSDLPNRMVVTISNSC